MLPSPETIPDQYHHFQVIPLLSSQTVLTLAQPVINNKDQYNTSSTQNTSVSANTVKCGLDIVTVLTFTVSHQVKYAISSCYLRDFITINTDIWLIIVSGYIFVLQIWVKESFWTCETRTPNRLLGGGGSCTESLAAAGAFIPPLVSVCYMLPSFYCRLFSRTDKGTKNIKHNSKNRKLLVLCLKPGIWPNILCAFVLFLF